MKIFLSILMLSFITAGAFAQAHKIIIYSYVNSSNCTIQYNNYDKLYPDSIKSAVMIDYKKQYGLKNISTVLLRMNLDGWKLLTTATDVTSVFGNANGTTQYLMSKEVLLDDAAMELYRKNLMNLK